MSESSCQFQMKVNLTTLTWIHRQSDETTSAWDDYNLFIKAILI